MHARAPSPLSLLLAVPHLIRTSDPQEAMDLVDGGGAGRASTIQRLMATMMRAPSMGPGAGASGPSALYARANSSLSEVRGGCMRACMRAACGLLRSTGRCIIMRPEGVRACLAITVRGVQQSGN